MRRKHELAPIHAWPHLLLLSLSLVAVRAPAVDAISHSDFTLVVLSDTQDYADRSVNYALKKWGKDCTSYFGIQTAWVTNNAKKLNIRFLLHTGDITQMDQVVEWGIARQAMSKLDGVVPYALSVGNHDMGCLMDGSRYGRTALNRESRLNQFFPLTQFKNRPWFHSSKTNSLANASYQFEHGDLKFMIVSLEFKPSDDTLAWANRLVAEYPDRRVIVITHGYLNPRQRGNSYSQLAYKVRGNDGKQIWDKFVSRHESIFLVLCGHTQGEGRRTDKGVHGNQVHQLLADYRHLKNGGESWLRYFVFQPARNIRTGDLLLDLASPDR